jgi:hypothetical protein
MGDKGILESQEIFLGERQHKYIMMGIVVVLKHYYWVFIILVPV